MTGARSARTETAALEVVCALAVEFRASAAVSSTQCAAWRKRRLSIRQLGGNARFDTASHRLVGLIPHVIAECERDVCSARRRVVLPAAACDDDECASVHHVYCLLYTSDAADERSSVDLG